MFRTTFLGHQGWAFHTDHAAILVDPLLREEFGDAQHLPYRVYPPRVMTPAAIPPLDAVVLTHEHDDHFDIPSLALLDRTIPIYLSVRSSRAARSILATMGFTDVRPLVPGVSVTFGDLELTPFTGDHVTVNCGDEWDTLPFLVRHTGGAGSFFTMVDITLTEQHVAWAAAKAMRPGLVAWTNNALDWSHMADFLTERESATQTCFVNLGLGHKLISTAWGVPAAMMMCANGFSFTGDSQWLDGRVFCVDMDAVCAMISKVYKKERFDVGRPGQTWVMAGNKLKAVDDSTAWLTTQPRETWPSRAKRAVEIPDFTPATERTTLTGDELGELRTHLAAFAGTLVGGAVMRGLCSLLVPEVGDRACTFAFALRDGDDQRVFAYAPQDCAFVDGDPTPRARYLAGLECWATDLLAVLRGELGPIALTFGRARLWNALPQRFHFDIFGELHRSSHPLRRPDASARTYERIWQTCEHHAPVVRKRER
ncbi:MAG: MBL fold metallo-hydrolase [Proteobacteria bacterium]|nr:MBL fold metallo-hydrolase [Pseudomonadota bacterium]